MVKDYYNVLGITKNADQESIKKAYRKLAKQFHPDVYKGDRKIAEEKFKEISEAYEILADPTKRAKYDRGGMEFAQETFGPEGFNWNNFTRQADVDDIFEGRSIFDIFFGGGGFQSGFGTESEDEYGDLGGGGGGKASRKGRDVVVEVNISLEEAAKGGEKLIRVPMGNRCEVCLGSGSKTQSSGICTTCKGAGQVRMVQQKGAVKMMRMSVCPSCRGKGQTSGPSCTSCEGAGYIQKPTKLSIKIKPGVDTGYRIRIPGGGEHSRGKEPGEMYIEVHVDPHHVFERRGDDLYMNATVPLLDAVVGGEIEVQTIEGSRAKVTIPAGTQPDTLLRLRGGGMPRMKTGGHGDMYIRTDIKNPTTLSTKQKNLLKEALSEI